MILVAPMVIAVAGFAVNVQAQGNTDSIGCRIKVDDAVKDQRTVNITNAYTYCLDKSG